MVHKKKDKLTNLQVAELAFGFVVTTYLSSIVSKRPPLYVPFANLQAWGRDWVQPGKLSIHQFVSIYIKD